MRKEERTVDLYQVVLDLFGERQCPADTLPFMVFFIATLLYEPAPRLLPGRWITIGLLILNLVLLAGFLFARYGNERNDYVSRAELDAMRYLYQVAPHGSVLVRSWDAGPWQFQDFENYDYYSLADDGLIGDVGTNNANAIVQFVQQEKRPHAYIVFTRSEQVTFDATSGLPPGRLALLEHEFLVSGKYRLIYQNRDVQILMFVRWSPPLSLNILIGLCVAGALVQLFFPRLATVPDSTT